MRAWPAVVLLTLAHQAQAGNFATCILDKMPGSVSQAMNAAAWQSCTQDYPDRFLGVVQGSGRGLFGFADGSACTLKKAAGTTFPPSAGAIARACRCLYDKPNPFDKPDLSSPDPVMCEYSQIDRFLR